MSVQKPNYDEASSCRLLVDIKEVSRILSMGERTIWRSISKGAFPRPISIGRRMKRWQLKDIEMWVNDESVKSGRNERGQGNE